MKNLKDERTVFVKNWRKELSKKLLRTQKELIIFGLNFEDFNKNIAIVFEDDSVANYNYAFFVENKEKYAIFTEHCGYFEYWKDSVKKIEEHNIFKVRLNFNRES